MTLTIKREVKGGSDVAEPRRTGFGTRLVDTTIKQQLGHVHK